MAPAAGIAAFALILSFLTLSLLWLLLFPPNRSMNDGVGAMTLNNCHVKMLKIDPTRKKLV
jgi:hypothetical protein